MSIEDRCRVGLTDLYRHCDLSRLSFETTADLDSADEPLGQNRAAEAIRFGIAMRHPGYNLFAMGSEGLGRRTLVHRLLAESAGTRGSPPDECYVFDFATPHRPARLSLPTGTALGFQRDMARLVEDLRAGIPAAFDADEYRSRRQELEAEFAARQEEAIAAVGEHARGQRIALLRTPGGFGFAPLTDEGVMPPEAFQRLTPEQQKPIEDAIASLQKELEAVIERVPRWRREAQRKLRDLNRQVTQGVVGSLIEEMRSDYASLPQVLEHLTAVQADVLDHADYFQQPKEGEGAAPLALLASRGEAPDAMLIRYAVNVLVQHDKDAGAPVVFEDHPTHDNLIGRLEYESRMGALVTDFTLIKAGALHRANGGYLILDAIKLLTQPMAWDALKRALRSREIRTEPIAQTLGLISTVSLEPQPIPLDLKLVLVGPRDVYYLLHAMDPEFADLFKVLVDFDEDMDRDGDAEHRYARLVASLARRHGSRPLQRAAVARAIEHAARRAGQADKLSLEIARLADLILEADQLAQAEAAPAIGTAHLQGAIDAQVRRAARIRDRLVEQTLAQRLLIDTAGERVGQINGLTVMQLGDYAFGMPARITASVRLGAGTVVDIERETRMGGALHAKGVLILSGYLAARYLPDRPLSLSASLVIEQNYGGVDGDSASSAELYALLSAIGRLPISQSLAVTGSVNQHGDVQAIGGVNDKIEGFFRLCQERGLTGSQGVIIPASNRADLMLSDDVTGAVREGRFHVFAVSHIDEGLALLTGLPAGQRGRDGGFEAGGANARIEARLAQLADRAMGLHGPRGRGRHGGPHAGG